MKEEQKNKGKAQERTPFQVPLSFQTSCFGDICGDSPALQVTTYKSRHGVAQ